MNNLNYVFFKYESKILLVRMWLLGHLSLGYFSSLVVGKYSKEKVNILLIWLLSIAPDIDEFFRPFIVHRGPTHSILVSFVVFLPILLKYRTGYAYLAALASHTLIGDFVTPPEQLFWPISMGLYGAPPALQLVGIVETQIEVCLFVLMLMVILIDRVRIRGV
ncbi:MAG: metal-dependent hydrolase [Candidatus Bathyarchaeota archaeon]|nr:metal-dependent hydrolase [Candidatus Bathyarchaeota archaeon]